MYETQETIPLRDWLTLGGILLGLIIIILLAVTMAQGTSSSIQVVNGQLVSASDGSTPQGKGASGQGKDNQNNQGGGVVVAPKDKKTVNQMSFIEVFLLLIFGAAIFTVIISVLIAVLVIQMSRIIRQIKKKPVDISPGKKE